MQFTLADWAPWAVGIVMVLFLVVSCLMVLTILIQKPQGGGLAAAFGGGSGSGQTAFGTKTGDALTVFTIIVFVLFLGTGVALVFGMRPQPADPAKAIDAPAGTAPATTPAATPATTPATTPAATVNPSPEPAQTPPANPPAGQPATEPAPPAPASPIPDQPAPAEPKPN
jgi:protein translocase SecG subunit